MGARRGWSEKGDIPSADGSSISPACYSRSDGMFINRLISEIGVRLRTIAGPDSSIAIKHKSIISIWPLCACRTFRLRRSRSLSFSLSLYVFIPYTCTYTYSHSEEKEREKEREGQGTSVIKRKTGKERKRVSERVSE